MSNSLQPPGPQHTRLLCPPLSPGVCANSCLLILSNRLILHCPLLCLLSIFSSIRVFSSELALPIRWPKYWSFSSATVLPMNIQDWFPLGLTGLISLQSKGLSRVFSSTTIQKHQFFSIQPSLWSNSHICTWLPETLFHIFHYFHIFHICVHMSSYVDSITHTHKDTHMFTKCPHF